MLVAGDLRRPAEVRALAAQVPDAGLVDTLVHNSGVWVRGNTPRRTADGVETTLAVNVPAPHQADALAAACDRLAGLA